MANGKNSVRYGGVRRFLRVLVSAATVVGLLLVVVTVTPLVDWWAGALAGPWNDPQGDVLIVLGGAVGEHGIMGANSYLRSEYAILAYREGAFRKLAISGGGQPIPIALAMRDFLTCMGVPPTAILVESASTSTRENAVYTKKLLEAVPGKKVLLTSDYHMFRAYRAFRKVGLDVAPRPIPDARKRATRWLGRWPAFLDLVQETAKILYYFARGWI